MWRLTLLLSWGCGTAWGQAAETLANSKDKDLTLVSLENLMNMEVTSASKKEERILRTAAAIFVITQADIRRSGMTSVPDLMRMVPGMQVAQINSSNWSISARGFNGRFADKLLVLIDGRSLYSPDFAGIFWQLQNLMLEDIERIEVLRGPGATLWGVNAVNGVINIITKKSHDTSGGLVSGGGGIQERGFGAVRYGGAQGDRFAYRVFGNYFNRGDFRDPTGHGAGDTWSAARGGFRADWQSSARDALTLEGDLYRVPTQGQTMLPSLTPPFLSTPLTTTDFQGGDLNGSWTHTYSAKSQVSLGMYYDAISRDDVLINAVLHTFNIELQHRFAAGSRNDVIWGVQYRLTADSTTATSHLSLNPAALQTHLASAFIQDEVTLIPARLWFSPAIMFEDNSFSGFNVESSGRLLLGLTDKQSVWLSSAESDRTPQRQERGLSDLTAVLPGQGSPIAVELFGDKQTTDQEILSFQAGYRAQIKKTLSFDLSAFYDHYKSLQTLEPGAPFFSATPVPHIVAPLLYANGMHGHGYGLETALSWKPATHWKLEGSYSSLRQIFDLNSGSQASASLLSAGDAPRNQFQLRSQLDLPHRTELDTSWYYVGKLPAQAIPSYTRWDARAGWHLGEYADLEVIGQNLWSPAHLEFVNNSGIVPTYNVRKAFARLTWRFDR